MELALQYNIQFQLIFLHHRHNPCFYGISFAILYSLYNNPAAPPVTILVFMELALQCGMPGEIEG